MVDGGVASNYRGWLQIGGIRTPSPHTPSNTFFSAFSLHYDSLQYLFYCCSLTSSRCPPIPFYWCSCLKSHCLPMRLYHYIAKKTLLLFYLVVAYNILCFPWTCSTEPMLVNQDVQLIHIVHLRNHMFGASMFFLVC